MKLVKDSRVMYDPSLSLYPAASVAGDTLIWNYTDLTNLTGGGGVLEFLFVEHSPGARYHGGCWRHPVLPDLYQYSACGY